MRKEKLENILYNKNSLFIISMIFLLSFCYLDNISILSRTVLLSSYFLSFIIVLFYLISGKYSKIIIYFLLFFITMLISSCIGQYSDLFLFIKTYIRILSFSMLLDLGLKYYTARTIKTLSFIFWILVFINFMTILLFPTGLYATERYTRNWFFMYENTHIFMYFPALLLSYLNMKLYKKKFQFIFLYLIIMFCVFFCKSATSIVAISIFSLFIVFENKLKKVTLLTSKNCLLLFLIIFFAIIIFRVQNIFSWLIVDILHKDLTFTDRIYIWDNAISYIRKKPLLGYGLEPTSIYSLKLGKIFYTHAHNTILDVLYKGGFISLFFFFQMLLSTVKKLAVNNKNVIIKTFCLILLCCFIMMNFEARQEKIGLYVILMICFYCDNILKIQEGDSNE